MKTIFNIAVPVLAVAVLAAFSFVDSPDEAVSAELQPPVKVYVCHGPGHKLDGKPHKNDYILNQEPAISGGAPTPRQVSFCEERHGGNIIQISSRAVKGHRVVNPDDVCRYENNC